MNIKTIIRAGRRFHGYDYSRGAVLFVTFGVKGRPPVFGHVAGDKVVYNAVGEAALATLQRERTRNRNLVVYRSVIMPDHVHLRIYIYPNTDEPLRQVGQFVANFKRWSKFRAAELGVAIEWEPNYHDRLCLSAEIIELVDKYIDNNPLKWALMHGDKAPLKVHEPLSVAGLPPNEWWTAAGNLALVAPGRRLAAMKLSRSIPAAAIPRVVARCLAALEKGYIPISTFISPAERALKAALIARKAPMVRVVPDPLATVYRPVGDEPPQFAAGNLLLLSRVAAPGLTRSEAWHQINDTVADFAVETAGVALYVVKNEKTGALDWRFAEGEAGRS